MTTVAIMQPTYLPWLGYFDLIINTDVFVFLDSVQFDKRSWQQRNRIKSQTGELMLTVPVLTKGHFDQKICEVMIDISQKFEKKHIKSIHSNYKKSKYFELYFHELEEIYKSRIEKLVNLNVALIKWLSSKLGVTVKFLFSSQLDVQGQKVELLIDICKIVGGDHYLSPAGSKGYIDENNLFLMNNIRLSYQNFKHSVYKQLYGEFIPCMAAIDLLFNEGENSKEIIKSGSSYD